MSEERFKAHVAVYVLLERHNQIFLLRRQNTGYMEGKLCFPSGHLDGEETVTAAAIRECAEESGILLSSEQLEMKHVTHSPSTKEGAREYINFYFIAKDWSGEPTNVETEKASECIWANLDHLPEDLVPEQRKALEDIKNGITYAEYGW